MCLRSSDKMRSLCALGPGALCKKSDSGRSCEASSQQGVPTGVHESDATNVCQCMCCTNQMLYQSFALGNLVFSAFFPGHRLIALVTPKFIPAPYCFTFEFSDIYVYIYIYVSM